MSEVRGIGKDFDQLSLIIDVWPCYMHDIVTLPGAPAGDYASFFINSNDYSFALSTVTNGDLTNRFKWVIQSARTQNPNIKIIALQFYGEPAAPPGQADFRIFNNNLNSIGTYADSVANSINTWYNATLPSIPAGGDDVSARINGWDVDVEYGTMQPPLPKILVAVRTSLNNLSAKLGTTPGGGGAPKFSVSITPAWTNYLNDPSVAQSVDYIIMQNYDGGRFTLPLNYTQAIPRLTYSKLNWGFSSETPNKNATFPFPLVKQLILDAAFEATSESRGIWTWRINTPDTYPYENIFQVWLYNIAHKTNLPTTKTEDIVAKYWPTGGRGANGKALTAAQMI
ncbi:uncharacterized protein KY384_008788 [Bacidia gigantensis]|uniref:uncharacterized protein n=1 Tax=Bacidia gigantensis TaxID=2732470 RepID=UPI001D04F378|nr:uncharacterized protein KY384_008788 [Bacidia gigantensis]KAG8526587.1 hypothetical protein KY384_008788 [Bacidia gigantensis]